jgi:hypothetical protein
MRILLEEFHAYLLAVSYGLRGPQYHIPDILVEFPPILYVGALDEHKVLLDFDCQETAIPLHAPFLLLDQAQSLMQHCLLTMEQADTMGGWLVACVAMVES